MAAQLKETQPWNLQPLRFDTWYEQNIQAGLKSFHKESGRVVDEVVQLIYKHAPLNVKEVIKGGSLGKGTVLKDLSDFDLVVMVNPPALPYLKDVENISSEYVEGPLEEVISEIGTAIEENADVESLEEKELMMTAELKVSGKLVDVDILPTADNLCDMGRVRLYESMMERSVEDREPYSAGLVRLQVNFIKRKPGVVKELIRVVRYWNKCTVCSILSDKAPLPTSYPMELITVYAWEKAGSPKSFNRLVGLKAVLTIIGEQLHTLRHWWTTNYNIRIARKGISKMRTEDRSCPLVLDPANPTNNVCARFHDNWTDVAKVARKTLKSELLKDIEITAQWD